MKIGTEKFGEVHFEESSVINFPEGILGFPDNKRYILINPEEPSPFKWLQNLEDGGLAFLVIDPCTFKSDYTIKLDESAKKELDIKFQEDYVVFVIVVVYSNPKDSTANLLGPIIVNVKNKRAKQIVLNDTNYTTKYKLIGGK